MAAEIGGVPLHYLAVLQTRVLHWINSVRSAQGLTYIREIPVNGTPSLEDPIERFTGLAICVDNGATERYSFREYTTASLEDQYNPRPNAKHFTEPPPRFVMEFIWLYDKGFYPWLKGSNIEIRDTYRPEDWE